MISPFGAAMVEDPAQLPGALDAVDGRERVLEKEGVVFVVFRGGRGALGSRAPGDDVGGVEEAGSAAEHGTQKGHWVKNGDKTF